MTRHTPDQQAAEQITMIGAALRQARDGIGQDIETIAVELRIAPEYLAALEAGNTGIFTGWPLATRYIREYAEYLELDSSRMAVTLRKAMTGSLETAMPAAAPPASAPEPAVDPSPEPVMTPPAPAATTAEKAPPPAPPRKNAPPRQPAGKIPPQQGRRHLPRGLIFIVTAFAGIAILIGWFFISQPGSETRIAPVPEKLKALLERAIAPKADTSGPNAPAAKPARQKKVLTRTKPLPELTAGKKTVMASAPDTAPVSVPAKTESRLVPPPEPLPEKGSKPGHAINVKPVDRLTVARVKTSPLPGLALPSPAEKVITAVKTAPAKTITATTRSSSTVVKKTADSVTRTLPAAVKAKAPAKAVALARPGTQAKKPLAATGTSAPATPVISDSAAAKRPDKLPAKRPPVSPTPALDKRITLRAIKPVNIRIANSAGNTVIKRNMKTGEMYMIPKAAGLVLEAENAGALEYFVDGKLQGTLGKAGEAIKNMNLGATLLDRPGG